MTGSKIGQKGALMVVNLISHRNFARESFYSSLKKDFQNCATNSILYSSVGLFIFNHE